MPSTALSPAAQVEVAHDLRRTIRELRDRGLLVAAKWYVAHHPCPLIIHRASELLLSLPRGHRQSPHLPFSPPPQQPILPSSPAPGPRPSLGDFLPAPGPLDPSIAGPSRARTAHGVEIEEEVDVLDEDAFQLAKSYFDMKEFDRVAWILKSAKGNRATFLRAYSSYLVGHNPPGPTLMGTVCGS